MALVKKKMHIAEDFLQPVFRIALYHLDWLG